MARFTRKDLDALDAAIASGEREVSYDNKRVIFRSISELKQARAIVASDVDPPTTPRVRRYAYITGWK